MAHFKIGAGFVVRLFFVFCFSSTAFAGWSASQGGFCYPTQIEACVQVVGPSYPTIEIRGTDCYFAPSVGGATTLFGGSIYSCQSATPVPTATPVPDCQLGKTSAGNTVAVGWSTLDTSTNPPNLTAYRGPSYQDFFNGFASGCQGGCVVDIFPGDPSDTWYDSSSGVNGWYKTGYDFSTRQTGATCSGDSLLTDQSGSEPPPQLCGTVNGQTVCVDAPPGSGTPVPGASGTPVPGASGTPIPGSSGTPSPGYTPQPNCGLPGNPPCKIDESGTPDGKGDSQGWLDGLDGVFGDTDSLLSDIKSTDGKDTTWSITPAWLSPLACTPWNFGTFAAINVALVIDICPHVPLAQAVINFIAYFFTFLGVTGMVFTTLTRGSS